MGISYIQFLVFYKVDMVYLWYDDEEGSILIWLINVIKVDMHIFLNITTAFYTSSLYLG